MLWFIHKRKSLFLSFLFFLSLLFFSLFISTGNSYATTVSSSFVVPSTNTSTLYFRDLGTVPDTSSLDSSLPWTYTLSGNFLLSKSWAYLSFSPGDLAQQCFSMSVLRSPSSFTCVISEHTFWSFRPYHAFASPFVSCNYSIVWSDYFSDFVLSISDDPISSSPSGNLDISENGTYDVTSYATATVNVENEVIYGDYHNDLITINNSILTCGAICLVIYFFYCIYRMIIKNSGVK